MTMAVPSAVLYSWRLQSQARYTVLVMVSFPLDIPTCTLHCSELVCVCVGEGGSTISGYCLTQAATKGIGYN